MTTRRRPRSQALGVLYAQAWAAVQDLREVNPHKAPMPDWRVQIPGYKCLRCGHTWTPRNDEKPRLCPKCKSAYWDRPRRGEAG